MTYLLEEENKNNKVLFDNVYDYYNQKMTIDGICGTLTAACGGTTTCGCFYVIEEDNDDKYK